MRAFSAHNLSCKLIAFTFFAGFVAGISGCSSRGNDEIIVIIEDPVIPSDTSVSTVADEGSTSVTPSPPTTTYPSTPQPPPVTRTMSLTGAVVLLKNDLESGNAGILTRHCDALLETVEGESARAEGERKRILDLFYLKLSSLKRTVISFEEEGIPPPKRLELTPQLDELHELARRIEGGD